MNTFTIKDIENFTGIKAHTIRIWEQRYNLLRPKRKDTNHRVYDNEDLKTLLKVSLLYHNGMKISHIAQLGENAFRQLPIPHLGKATIHSQYINEMIEATLDFDQVRFEKVFQYLWPHIGFEESMVQVIYPFLEKIGLLWLTSNVIPAQEHFSSNIIRKKMLVAIDTLALPEKSDEHYLLFLPEGEFHEIPLLFAQYLLLKNGKMVTNFGANVPLEDAQHFVKAKGIPYVFTHLLTSNGKKETAALVTAMITAFPQSRIILSGPQFQQIDGLLPDNVYRLYSLEALLAFTKDGIIH